MNVASLKNLHEWPIMTKSLVIGLICAIVFYMTYRWDLADMKSKLVAAQQKEKDIMSQLQLIITQQQAANDNIQEFNKLKNTLNEWQKKLIFYSELPILLNTILKFGADNHLNFSLFNPDTVVQVEAYKKIPIEVVVVGSYHQIANFLSEVANLTNIVEIGNFDLANDNKPELVGTKLSEKANSENLITGKLLFNIYLLNGNN